MKTLFVMDPLELIHIDGDSTYMLMLEARRRGWPVSFCTPGDMYAIDGATWGKISAVEVSDEAPYFVPEPAVEVCLGEFDVVWMRKDPPFDMDYIFSTYLLDLVPDTTMVLNDPATIRNANEKMYAMQWPHLCPPTLATRHIARAKEWAKQWEKIVLKPWDGNGGRGVLVSHAADANLRSMIEILTEQEKQYILVQRYIPEITQGDKRIILIDGEPVGWMARIPQPGDHRGNMHVGATVEAFELTARDREICDALAPRLKAEGLLFVGIDIIGNYLTEINVTSPTGIQEINRLMGLRLERTLTDAVVNRFNNGVAS